jgi:hypothetical protein
MISCAMRGTLANCMPQTGSGCFAFMIALECAPGPLPLSRSPCSLRRPLCNRPTAYRSPTPPYPSRRRRCNPPTGQGRQQMVRDRQAHPRPHRPAVRAALAPQGQPQHPPRQVGRGRGRAAARFSKGLWHRQVGRDRAPHGRPHGPAVHGPLAAALGPQHPPGEREEGWCFVSCFLVVWCVLCCVPGCSSGRLTPPPRPLP